MKKTLSIVCAAMALVMAGSLPGYAHGHAHFGDGHAHFSGGIWVGPGWGWGPGWGGYPYYPYYPYYAAPPVVVEQQPEVYVQPAPQPEAPAYWYFCQEAGGYYPYVKQCPGGWLKVVPTPPQPPKGKE